jgi:hypothetical protein
MHCRSLNFPLLVAKQRGGKEGGEFMLIKKVGKYILKKEII